MAYIYTPFMKKVLHITERKRESNVHHYCKSDDFRAGFEVAEWGVFCHSERLQSHPTRLKQFSLTVPSNDLETHEAGLLISQSSKSDLGWNPAPRHHH